MDRDRVATAGSPAAHPRRRPRSRSSPADVETTASASHGAAAHAMQSPRGRRSVGSGAASAAPPPPPFLTAVGGGNGEAREPQEVEVMNCPICLTLPQEAFVTRCGHTFCYECISRQLQVKSKCPTCGMFVSHSSIQPNHAVDAAIRSAKRQRTSCFPEPAGGSSMRPRTPSFQNSGNLAAVGTGNAEDLVADMNEDQLQAIFEAVKRRKEQVANSKRQHEDALLLDFLGRAKSDKEGKILQLQNELSSVKRDISAIETKLRARNVSTEPPRMDLEFQQKQKRLGDHFAEFEEHYFKNVAPTSSSSSAGRAREGSLLNHFAEDLTKFAKYSGFKCCATLRHSARSDGSTGTGDGRSASNIVSSIEFDKDSERIATAGVMKRIKIFEYSNVLTNRVEVHYPIQELETRAKLSCLSWNSYIRNHLISSDYEGVITLYDVERCMALREFEEHEKRAWSVHFSTVEPTRFASASDDGRVKFWSTHEQDSEATIENRANVCCVQFSPTSSYELAFGSADHNVQFYDIRNPRQAVYVLPGHAKAVSYARFLSGDLLCSASTDSTLKLWNVRTGECVRTFMGHQNDKNFVGLSVTEDYIACGSENNSLFTYYKALSRPLLSHKCVWLKRGVRKQLLTMVVV